MRVLYCDHPEADFLSGVLYMGLCEELGADQVVDYPPKDSFKGKVHYYPSPYTHAAWPADDIDIPSWQKLAKEAPEGVGCTAPFEWMTAQSTRSWSRDEVVAGLKSKDFDLVILASPRKYNSQALTDLTESVGRSAMPPIVLVDGEDYSQIRQDLADTFGVKVYFKRELLPGAGRGGLRVEPFPFASPVPARAAVAKTIDVLFIGGGSWPGRQVAVDALRNAFGERFVRGAGYSYSQYLDAIASARVAVSVRGHGYDTLRYWEIPSFDTLLVADRQPVIRPFPFQHGVHALFFDTTHELVEAVRCALEDEPWQRRLALAGNSWLRAHHTARARARQLLTVSVA